MGSALDFGVSAQGSGPGRGHCVVFLGKTLYSHGPANLMVGVAMRWTSILSRKVWGRGGGVELLLVPSCYRNQDKLRLNGPLGL